MRFTPFLLLVMVRGLILLILLSGAARAQEGETVDVYLNNRLVAAFRSDAIGGPPAERARLAQQAMREALNAGGPGEVSRSETEGAVRFEIDGRPVFFLTAGDLVGSAQTPALGVTAHQVQRRLQQAVHEDLEMRDWRRIGIGLAYSLAATATAAGVLWLLLKGRRWLRARLQGAPWNRDDPGVTPYLAHARSALQLLGTATLWLLALVLTDAWLSFVLRQFAYTRPWGERSTDWLLQTFEQFVRGIAHALPGLAIAVVIFLLARVVTRANTRFLQRVARGDTRLGWLDADTAVPTQRLGNVLVWLFALAMAYPYLPGSDTEAFKGVSVMAGLMLSLGATGAIGQAVSGLSLMYARAMRVGEYVKVGETEGTVTQMGLFVTRIQTGMGEEVSLPNSVVFSQPVRNFSRLVQDGRFVLHTSVTIGYATPWRQVHAMLLEAARRTPGVATEPAPYVLQTALSDFYVEYRLCAQSNRSAPGSRVEAMSQLHANVQDVFHQHGVQIMSPHYFADPPAPQVVPAGDPWASPDTEPPLRAPERPTTF